MIHIAVLLKPYLDLVLSGEKTVECRLTLQARAPFEGIESGERMYLKQSSGPYRAIAVADHVLFESELTQARIRQLRRDYNHLIRGENAFWKLKRRSRFGTLIWLRDVEPIDAGPAIRPLQGRAWESLEEEPAWRLVNAGARDGTSFAIPITPGNLRNSTLSVTEVVDRFPVASLGGRTRREAGRAVTLMLHHGPTVRTDVVAARKLFRTRAWGAWFRRHGARPGDRVVFTPVGDDAFLVGLARRGR